MSSYYLLRSALFYSFVNSLAFLYSLKSNIFCLRSFFTNQLSNFYFCLSVACVIYCLWSFFKFFNDLEWSFNSYSLCALYSLSVILDGAQISLPYSSNPYLISGLVSCNYSLCSNLVFSLRASLFFLLSSLSILSCIVLFIIF